MNKRADMAAPVSSSLLILLAMLSLQLISCGQDAEVKVIKPRLTNAGRELLSKLKGTWVVTTYSEGNCAIDAQLAFPVGRARFEIEDDALLIEPLDGVGDEILLFPIDGVSLLAQVDFSSASCRSSLTCELSFTTLGERSFSGIFGQFLTSSDSITCPYEVPACQQQTNVSGIRR
ncbi:MAG: hypothetical protein ACPGQS_07570 [Bradymonadia bacterium]